MTSALQNRLVGTIILVAIAVIFLPDLLNGKKKTQGDLFIELPQKPAMKKVLAPQGLNTSEVRKAASRQIEIVNESAVDEPGNIPEQGEETAQVSEGQTEISQGPVDDSVPQAEAFRRSSLERETVIEEDQQQFLESAGWVVQLGSFRHQQNVQELLGKLEKGGYRAFSRPVQTSSGELTKVFVGPDLDKEKLEKAVSHLKELTKLQGRVTPFTVQ